MNTDKIISQDDQIIKESQIKDQKELKFLGSARRIPGHTLFSINVKTEEIKPAKMNNKCLFVPHGGTLKPAHKSVVQVEKDCIYLQALNFKNAKKKFEKIKSNEQKTIA